ncbi:alanine racemase [Streptococcus caprae]|uniref:Alanine racemase n=1 Tax=Streptococcus caprae TaxID=1640501 RepID=A0ABV8CWC2_9STRE
MIASHHRPTEARVNLGAIRQNVSKIQEHLPQGVQTLAVVKANAYGHGSIEVSRALSAQVDGFCVSNLDEAMELRQAGLDHMILILGVLMPNQLELARLHKISITVSSLEWLELVEEQGLGLTGLSCHIKVDSGMGRIGVSDSRAIQEAQSKIQALGANVTGIFTHFATADETDQDFFQEQLAVFKSILADLPTLPAMVHASNSATSLWHEDGIFNAVRLGIAIYGLNPSGETLSLPYDLSPALKLVSSLVQVKSVSAGQRIGYGGTYSATSDEIIGTVPIGYADGWTRAMQDFSVLVNGKACQIVGRVSMDQITIRLPEFYPLGTEVVLIGKSGQLEVTATDVAEYRGTINYEVLCLISDRVPRIYKQ